MEYVLLKTHESVQNDLWNLSFLNTIGTIVGKWNKMEPGGFTFSTVNDIGSRQVEIRHGTHGNE